MQLYNTVDQKMLTFSEDITFLIFQVTVYKETYFLMFLMHENINYTLVYILIMYKILL